MDRRGVLLNQPCQSRLYDTIHTQRTKKKLEESL